MPQRKQRSGMPLHYQTKSVSACEIRGNASFAHIEKRRSIAAFGVWTRLYVARLYGVRSVRKQGESAWRQTMF